MRTGYPEDAQMEADMAKDAIKSRVEELATRGPTRLENHLSLLHEANSNMERIVLLANNLLVKLRGNVPEPERASDIVRGDPPLLESIDEITNEILIKANDINQMMDELTSLN